MRKQFIEKAPKTIAEIYEAIHTNDINLGEPLGQILNHGFKSLEDIYEFLDASDSLVDAMYDRNEDGNYVFSFASKHGDDVTEIIAPLGCQTSRYHKEDFKQHVAIVSAKFAELGLSNKDAALYAVLHDCAKKYTFGTNYRGEVCFYGHEALSAFIGGYWLFNNWYMTGDELRQIIAVIWAHLHPRVTWAQKPEERDKFIDQLRTFFDCPMKVDETMRLVDLFAQADLGCESEEEIEAYADIISRGEQIIRNAKI